ncbi:hypothetical protein FNH05_01595 [Amycolatopsis rhizosphaerae]|uniref:DUF4913 domain-containing protein n=1 Tax=Amycolatopsis rhizosphaerae TaxID=2053003 RepID=A0A558DLV0_9PSEU|nr:hypothetical protein [Amycolatopsis rhizosphaerae]TVT61954.1 hypothetical protein FNH05_01595 [Amycolatopsis rhizosphaerae]
MAELPEHERRKDQGERDLQIAALTQIVGTLAQNLRRVEGQVNWVAKIVAEARDEQDSAEPAAWLWFNPPAATEDEPQTDQDPRLTVKNFVTWYNNTFVGIDGGRAKPIPACWRQHPGLAMEVATLAYSWRSANMGSSASAREAQYWLHQWRPGFAERLTRDWVHADCLDDGHRDEGAPPREDRFTVVERHAATVKDDRH